MKTQLNQIIAVEKGVKSRAHQDLTTAHHALLKPDLLSGIARKYSPKLEDGDKFPDESTKVQVKAEDMIADTAKILTELFDVTATKDWTNCVAKADVIVDGHIILAQAPVSYLLFLEKQLVDLHTFVKKLPVLDAASNWRFNKDQDCFASDAVDSFKTRKEMKNHIRAAATDKHPAQVDVYTEDVVIGTWTTTKFSGALQATRVKDLLGKVEKLQKAVKYAREQANGTEVIPQSVGAEVFNYLFGDK